MEQARLLDAATGRARAAVADLRSIQKIATERGLSVRPWAVISRATAEAACGDLLVAATELESLLDDQAGSTLDALVWATTTLAEVLRLQGDDRAEECARRGLELARSIDDRFRAAGNQLVSVDWLPHAATGPTPSNSTTSALRAIIERGYRLELPRALEARAHVACGLGRDTEAARILGAAERTRRDLGLVAWPAQRAEVDTLTARLREALGDHGFTHAHSEGTALTEADALA